MHVLSLRLPRIERRGVLRGALEGAIRGAGGLRPNDVLAVTSKVVSYDEGCVVELAGLRPTKRSTALARKARLDPGFAQLVVREADAVLGAVPGAIVTLKAGHLCANAGADQSNAPPGHAVVWPKDPWASAERIRKFAAGSVRGPVGVVVTDSHCEPLRMGTSGVALACAGFLPVEDVRGREDLFGHTMRITFRAVADGLASAAVLKMGEVDESTPAAILRDSGVTVFARKLTPTQRASASIPPDRDLFAPAYRAAVLAGARRRSR